MSGWQDVSSKRSKNNKIGKVNETHAEPVQTAQKPTAFRATIAGRPELFCINCYVEHPDQRSYDSCVGTICEYCKLPETEAHNQSQCTAAVCSFCKKHGHDLSACRVAPPPCKFCKEIGHFIQDCDVLKNTECEKCHEHGHVRNRCPKRFKCNYCVENRLEASHQKLKYDRKIDDYVVVCPAMQHAIKTNKYVCPRCAYSDCWFTCKDQK